MGGPTTSRVPANQLMKALALPVSETAGPNAGVSNFEQVKTCLGEAICGGGLAPDSIITVDDLEVATGVSRSVIREVVRVLVSMGLLRARRKLGFQVLPDGEWNLFDPQIIRWRLASPNRDEQVRTLLEVRYAIEPEAARLACIRSSAELAGRIMSVAGAMWSAGDKYEPMEFARQDAEFHRLVLLASGNTLFARLSGVIRESLQERNLHQVREAPVSMDEVQLHIDLASYIQRREGDEASRVAREIVLQAQGETR